MRYLRALGLAVVAACVLTALLGATSASATVLCKNNNETAKCAAKYGKVTLESSLVAGKEAVIAFGIPATSCPSSTVKYKVEKEGSGTETVSGTIAALEFAECTCEVEIIKKGSFEIHWITGSDDGTLTAGVGIEFAVDCGAKCTYANNEAIDLGRISGGKPAIVAIHATFKKVAGGITCGGEAVWAGEYEVTAPNPLYVSSAG